jgi:imidazolonepropionase-like amidohydrolase
MLSRGGPGGSTAGTVVDEIRQLIAHGLSPTAALGAGSTVARSFLGAPALEDGAPADVVTFDDDPRDDPEILRYPAAVVIGGRRVA